MSICLRPYFGSWYNFKRGLLEPRLKAVAASFSKPPLETVGLVFARAHSVAGCGMDATEWPHTIAGISLHLGHPSFFLPRLLALPLFLPLFTPLPPPLLAIT